MKIDVWYGHEQSFGRRGSPQSCVNVLGAVREHGGLRSLAYSLNDGPLEPLRVGADRRRLASPGDFAIDVDRERLRAGANTFRIVATDRSGDRTQQDVSVVYEPAGDSSIPYAIDWDSADSIQDAAHVVDGRWTLEDGSLRTVEPGYDRMVAIGDVGWRDYEITVPMRIHTFDETGFRHPSLGPGVGVMLRWRGHYHWKGEQSWRGWWPVRTASRLLGQEDWGEWPRWGWWPLGALAWYRWSQARGYRLNLMGNRGASIAEDTSGRTLCEGTGYVLRAAVESRPGSTACYRLKVWAESEAEPAGWDLVGDGVPGEPDAGSVVLVAHHADVSFGPVAVRDGRS